MTFCPLHYVAALRRRQP